MTIIKTKRNIVYAYDQQPDDVFVSVGWTTPCGDAPHGHIISLRERPITEYKACVDWALSMADMLVYPIHVVPISGDQFLTTSRFQSYRNMLANLNDQERGEMRQQCIATAAQVMRDCPDPEVRAHAYDILITTKVIRP